MEISVGRRPRRALSTAITLYGGVNNLKDGKDE